MHHDDLNGLRIKLLQSLDRLARFEAIRRRTPDQLTFKDALGFAYRNERFSITDQDILLGPVHLLIPAFPRSPVTFLWLFLLHYHSHCC